jgi:hypothetical protein
LRRKVVLAVSSLAGLLLAVAGLTPAASNAYSLPGRLVFDLPVWLGIPFLLLLCLEALFILYLLAPRMRRRKGLGQGSRAMAPAIFLLMVMALGLGLRNHLAIDLEAMVRSLADATSSAPALAPQAEAPPPIHSAVIDSIVETSLLALALVGFGVLAWLYLALLPPRAHHSPSPFAPSDLQVAIEDSLDDLRHLPDARLAIIRCYARFERVLAGADVRRSPWQTVVEFMQAALTHPHLPSEAVRELTRLFEIARFSRHELGPDHRERAWQALMAIKAALEKEHPNASAV